LRLDGTCRDHARAARADARGGHQRALEFDVIHFPYLAVPSAGRAASACRTRHHDARPPRHARTRAAVRRVQDVPLVSISDAQREPLREAGWIGTIHHGLPIDLLPFDPGPGKYLAFLGRIAREKRVDRAIAIATACGQPLRIAAKIDPADRDYFEDEIRPLLDNPLVEYIGEISE
jgi:glycosyltransferase involved in cell wall biosynthesis